MVNREYLGRQQAGIVQEILRTQAGDTRRHVEDALRQLTGHQVGLVALRHRNHQVGIRRPGVAQHAGRRCVADHRTQIQLVLQRHQARSVVIDDSDIVFFGNQPLGHAGTDLAGTENDDFHTLPE